MRENLRILIQYAKYNSDDYLDDYSIIIKKLQQAFDNIALLDISVTGILTDRFSNNVLNLEVPICLYNNKRWITSAEVSTLRTDVVSQLNTIANLTYSLLILSCYRNNETTSTGYVIPSNTHYSDVVIYNVNYESNIWQNNPVALLSVIHTALDGIANFEFESCVIEVFQTVTSQFCLLNIRNITFNGTNNLTEASSNTLRNNIRTTLNGISNFVYEDVIIRSAEYYT